MSANRKDRLKSLFYIILLVFLIGSAASAENHKGVNNSGFDDELNIEITNINSDNFPNIHIYVRVTDEQGIYIPDLSYNNFTVWENGVVVQDNVQAEFGYMAVSLVMDASGSMSGYELDVIEACNTFVNGLEDLDKGAVIEFASAASVTVPMTYDKDDLYSAIAQYAVGGMTALWAAIELGITESYYEPEKKAVVAFTDGNNNQPGCALNLPEMAGSDITIYTIGIGNIASDSLIWVAEQTGGFYLPIEDPSQMGLVLEDIRNDIGNLYDVFYVSPDPTPNGTVRDLQVVCDYNTFSDWDTTSYIAPLTTPPYIVLSLATLELLSTAQNAGSSLPITCQIRGQNPISDARIYYKRTGDQYFSQAVMINSGGTNYYYNIPGGTVQSPGVEFYIQTTDNQGSTITSPAYLPGYLPYTIPVLPNLPVEIVCDLPDIWLTRSNVVVEATITDPQGGNLMQVSLFHRVPGSFFFYETNMEDMGDDVYQTIIDGTLVNAGDDFELFIGVWDNAGFVNYWNLSEFPFYLDVVEELPPTLPALVLEPASTPIIIPATGGSFDYSVFTINPIPDSAVCDVWVDILRPDGSWEEIGLLLEEVDLTGGETVIDNFTQEVPDTAMTGSYTFYAYTGDFSTGEEYFSDCFTFSKSAALIGPRVYNQGWKFYRKTLSDIETDNYIGYLDNSEPVLYEAFPNPFNNSTSFRIFLPRSGRVELALYNIAGEKVATLLDDFKAGGEYSVHWNAVNAASGMYFCRMQYGNKVSTKKVLLVK